MNEYVRKPGKAYSCARTEKLGRILFTPLILVGGQKAEILDAGGTGWWAI